MTELMSDRDYAGLVGRLEQATERLTEAQIGASDARRAASDLEAADVARTDQRMIRARVNLGVTAARVTDAQHIWNLLTRSVMEQQALRLER